MIWRNYVSVTLYIHTGPLTTGLLHIVHSRNVTTLSPVITVPSREGSLYRLSYWSEPDYTIANVGTCVGPRRIKGQAEREKQMVKVIRHKVTSSLQTNGSIVFAIWRQRTPPSSTPESESARHVRTSPGLASFRPQKCPFARGDLDPCLTHGSWDPP